MKFSRNHLYEEFKRLKFIRKIAGIKPPLYTAKLIHFFIALILFAVLFFLLSSFTEMPREAIYMAGIFLLSAYLWVTEALPLFATALLVMGLEIVFIANPGNWPLLGFSNGLSPNYTVFIEPMANPVIILFLGGFLLAMASVKQGVDKALASTLLKFFGNTPIMIMLGLMLVTAVFSMFMSNTATTAMMITLVIPLLKFIPKADPFNKALILCIPFAANIGGMGTPIASPPNAVAMGFLKSAGFEITFLQWMLIAIPLMAALLLVAFFLLWTFYKPKEQGLLISLEETKIDKNGWFVIVIFSSTVLLWLTDQLHGLPAAAVALLPAIAFTATGLIRRSDYNSLEWHILTLIAGGIALGVGMKITGLDAIIINEIPTGSSLVFILLVVATILFSTFMSNTAAANLIIPIGISFAANATGGPHEAIVLGVSIALAASVAMSLPISTPPNAIAYARGILTSKDFMLIGSIMGILALVLILFFGKTIIEFWMTI